MKSVMGYVNEITDWVFNYLIVLLLVLFSIYVYMNWVAPWSYLYWVGLFVYLCVAAEHYTNPKNFFTYDEEKPLTENQLEAAEFQAREDAYNISRGRPIDDPDNTYRQRR